MNKRSKTEIIDYPKEDGRIVRCIMGGDKEFAWLRCITFDKDGKVILDEE